jgi:hypothetical protein
MIIDKKENILYVGGFNFFKTTGNLPLVILTSFMNKKMA